MNAVEYLFNKLTDNTTGGFRNEKRKEIRRVCKEH